MVSNTDRMFAANSRCISNRQNGKTGNVPHALHPDISWFQKMMLRLQVLALYLNVMIRLGYLRCTWISKQSCHPHDSVPSGVILTCWSRHSLRVVSASHDLGLDWHLNYSTILSVRHWWYFDFTMAWGWHVGRGTASKLYVPAMISRVTRPFNTMLLWLHHGARLTCSPRHCFQLVSAMTSCSTGKMVSHETHSNSAKRVLQHNTTVQTH